MGKYLAGADMVSGCRVTATEAELLETMARTRRTITGGRGDAARAATLTHAMTGPPKAA
jgi:hypothetical protein